MFNRIAAMALLWSGASAAWASVPEIDGGLSLQAIALTGGVLYLLRKKK
jgi:hypothetical protein